MNDLYSGISISRTSKENEIWVEKWEVRDIGRKFPLPLFQNEFKCETFHMKISFPHKFIQIQILTHFYMKGFALGLVLKQRQRALFGIDLLHTVCDVHVQTWAHDLLLFINIAS